MSFECSFGQGVLLECSIGQRVSFERSFGLGVSFEHSFGQGASFECSFPTSAKVKNKWSYVSAPSVLLYGVVRDSFTFTFYLYFSHDGLMASNHTFFLSG